MAKAKSIMLQGTASNVGKSILVAALCRLLKDDGFSVAPFKAQNMALNSYVTKDGLEMGRAQVTQAYACKIEPDVRMNPVLLKPNSDTGSQVVLNGKPVGSVKAVDYYKRKRTLFPEVLTAYNSLAEEYEIVVLEGAGSCAEVNLRKNDIVNMAMARAIDAPVLLVGDIDRGGVFAHLVGTCEVLEPEDRNMIKGFLINKFRGDASLLKPALDFLLERTGTPTLGVLNWLNDLKLPEEDSVEFKKLVGKNKFNPQAPINIAVVDLPHISNFTDFDAFAFEPDVNFVITDDPEGLEKFDAVILPGSKNTINDLKFLREKGFAEKLKNSSADQRIIGICGGYQMLGKTIKDPERIESDLLSIDGLGLLDHETFIGEEKKLIQTNAFEPGRDMIIKGYEIHHGKTISNDKVILKNEEGTAIGTTDSSGKIWGAYLHGIFDNDIYRNEMLNKIRMEKNLEPRDKTEYSYEKEFSRLADSFRKYVDMDSVYKIIGV